MIRVNDANAVYEPGMTVADLLEAEGMDPAIAAVWMNDELVPRDRHQTTVIPDEASIQIVLLASGG